MESACKSAKGSLLEQPWMHYDTFLQRPHFTLQMFVLTCAEYIGIPPHKKMRDLKCVRAYECMPLHWKRNKEASTGDIQVKCPFLAKLTALGKKEKPGNL